jgi:GT2 family glycosyltransferase
VTTPSVVVVLASFRPRAIAEGAIAALLPQCTAHGVGLVVARRPADADESWLGDRFPGVLVVSCPATADVPRIRGAGLRMATAEWVFLTEDNCLADPDWLPAMMAALNPDAGVIGGSMGNARTARIIDWGAFFAEYGFFGPETIPGEPVLVTGANVAYRGDLVEGIAALALAGDWEDVIHGRLSARGVALARAPRAVVRQQLHYRLGSFMRDRFEHGRDYATVRRDGWGFALRLLHGVAAPALPLLLAARIWRATGRHSSRSFWRALPATLVFLLAWGVGESFGYLRSPSANA